MLVLEQPFESVTHSLYVPGVETMMHELVEPLCSGPLHLYEYCPLGPHNWIFVPLQLFEPFKPLSGEEHDQDFDPQQLGAVVIQM